MQNKIKFFGLLLVMFSCVVSHNSYADNDLVEETIEYGDVDYNNKTGLEYASDAIVQDIIGATSVADYDVNGTVFQQITDLEQEKVLMQLEKERAQLDLDLDRLAAEKIKLQMEMDTLSGRADQERQILQNEKSKLEAEAARIEQEKRALTAATESTGYSNVETQTQPKKAQPKKSAPKKVARNVEGDDIASLYKLVNVMGAGNQLQATLSDLETGQTKRVSVGKKIDGFTVKSISLEDGVVFSKDGETQNLNISSR